MSPAYYLVIDLEATCDDQGRIPRHETEIIEIGAVLVDGKTLEPVDELDLFIKPVIHPVLTPFCVQLTTITQEQVDGGLGFVGAVMRLGSWVNGRDARFCSWGEYDRKQLSLEATRNGLRLPFPHSHHLNLKEEFRVVTREKKKLGAHEALERVGLAPLGTHHRGIDDARNIARLLPYIVGKSRVPPAAAP